MWQGIVAWSLRILKIRRGTIKRRLYSLIVGPCDMRSRHDGSPQRRCSLTSSPMKSQTLRHWRTRVNRIFGGKTSRYEYLCMIYDLAHSRSPASRRRVEDMGFVRSSVSTYSDIYREREREWKRKRERKRKRGRKTHGRSVSWNQNGQIRMETVAENAI